MKRSILAVAVLLSSGHALAQVEANNPNFNYVEAGYVEFDIDGVGEISPAGFTVSAAKQFDQFYVSGKYLRTTDDISETYDDVGDSYEIYQVEDLDVTVSRYELSAGYIWDVDDNATLDVAVAYGNVDFKVEYDSSLYVRYYDNNGNEIDEEYSDNGSDSSDENYFNAAVRYTVNLNDFVLKGTAGAERFDSSDTDTEFFYTLEAGYFVTEQFSMNVIYLGGSDYSTAALTARYHF